jgi:hypothetical protein
LYPNVEDIFMDEIRSRMDNAFTEYENNKWALIEFERQKETEKARDEDMHQFL